MEPPLEGTYETRCNELADRCEERLTKLGKIEDLKNDDLKQMEKILAMHVQLAEYKVKFRQADHVKPLLYGPVAIAAAGFVLALFSGIQAWQAQETRDLERQRGQASLVLKVLEAKNKDAGVKLLIFFDRAKLLTLKEEEKKELTGLLGDGK